MIAYPLVSLWRRSRCSGPLIVDPQGGRAL